MSAESEPGAAGQEGESPGGHLIERREIHQGRTIRVSQDTVRFPDGATGVLDHIRHPGAAAIVPFLDPLEAADPRIILLRQFRYSVGGPIIEVPAGTRSAPGEDLDLCAERELEEETGYRAGEMARLGRIYTTPGFTDEVIFLYAAWNLSEGELHRDRDEYMELVVLPLSKVFAMIREGEIVDAKSVCALHLAGDFLARRSHPIEVSRI